MFEKAKIDGYYFTAPGFYIFHIPVKVPYKQIYALADRAGVTKKEAFGPILESSKIFGSGWIGVEIEKPQSERESIRYVAGNFQVYEHCGPYKTLGQAYAKIKKQQPKIAQHFNLYLDDPEKTKPENCRTKVFFR